MKYLNLLALLLATTISTGVHAGEKDRSSEINAIIKKLDVDENVETRINISASRNVTIKIGSKIKNIIIDIAHSIDLTVFFNFDSSVLTKSGKKELDKLGAALSSKELKPQRFLIAGHTDAKGPREYNRKLSLNRAISVSDYLIKNWGIDASRLEVHGWGASQLRDRNHPRAAINRRVEVSYILPETAKKEGDTIVIIEQPAQIIDRATVECPEQNLSDPRPAKAPLDHFGGARTPLPCAPEINGTNTGVSRIKLNK